MQDYEIGVRDEFFDEMLVGNINNIILVNSGKVATYKVANQIILKNLDHSEENFTAEITNLFYFPTIMEALEIVGKKDLGYKSKYTLTQIEDKLLARMNVQEIEKHGVVVIEFKKI